MKNTDCRFVHTTNCLFNGKPVRIFLDSENLPWFVLEELPTILLGEVSGKNITIISGVAYVSYHGIWEKSRQLKTDTDAQLLKWLNIDVYNAIRKVVAFGVEQPKNIGNSAHRLSVPDPANSYIPKSPTTDEKIDALAKQITVLIELTRPILMAMAEMANGHNKEQMRSQVERKG
jgi:hypothetical protein